jgi:hypothetical protein
LSIDANPTSQLAAHGKPRNTPFETTPSSPGRSAVCGSVDDQFATSSSRRQSSNNHPHANALEIPKLPVARSRSHIMKPAVNHAGNTPNAKELSPAGPMPDLSTAQTRKPNAAELAAHGATGDQEATNNNKPKVHENKRLSFAREASLQIDLPEYLAAGTSNITSPPNSPDRAFGRSNNAASDTTESPSRPTAVKPPKVQKTVSSSRKKADTSKQSKNQKIKGKPALITPLEYARKLQLNFELGKKRKSDYLRGKQIFYVGGDMQYASSNTRGRMDYVSLPCFYFTFLPSLDMSTIYCVWGSPEHSFSL